MADNIFEHIPLSLIIINNNDEVVKVNHFARKQFLYESNDFFGKKLDNFITQLDFDSFSSQKISHFSIFNFSNYNKRNLATAHKKDGSKSLIEFEITPLENKHTKLVSVLDVSLKTQEEERFRTAFDSSPSGMIMIDKSRNIVLVNKKIEEIFGFKKE